MVFRQRPVNDAETWAFWAFAGFAKCRRWHRHEATRMLEDQANAPAKSILAEIRSRISLHLTQSQRRFNFILDHVLQNNIVLAISSVGFWHCSPLNFYSILPCHPIMPQDPLLPKVISIIFRVAAQEALSSPSMTASMNKTHQNSACVFKMLGFHQNHKKIKQSRCWTSHKL